MNKFLLLILTFCFVCPNLIAQEQEEEQQEIEKKYKIVFRQSAGIFIGHPSEGVNASLNMEIQNLSFLGVGIDLTNGLYRSPELNPNPSANEIDNYDPMTNGSIPRVIANGSDKDKFWGISPFLSKGFDINTWFSVELQGGPSIALIKKRTYTYSYIGPSGSFGGYSFGSGSYVFANSSGSTEATFGAYVRAYASFKIGEVLTIELSPFTNFNNIENEYGIQLGIGFRI